MSLLDILNSVQGGPRGQSQQPASGGSGMSPIMMALLGLVAAKALQGGGLGNILGGGQQPAPAGGAGRTAAPPPGSPDTDAQGGGGLADILGSLLGGGQPAGGQGRTAAPTPGGAGGLGDILGSLLGGGQPATGGGAGRTMASAPARTAEADNPGGAGGLGDILGGLFGGGAGGNVLSGGLDKLVRDLQSSGQGDVAKSWVGTGPNKQIEPENLEAAIGANTLDTLAGQTGMQRDQLLSALSQTLPGFVDKLTPNGRVPTEREAAQLVARG